MADEIKNRIPVVFIVHGIIRFQDGCLVEITLESCKKIGREIIEIRIFRAIEHSSSCCGKIECGFFIDRKDIVQTGILYVIGQIGIFKKVGIFSLCKKRKPGEVFVHVETQVRELISFSESVLKKVVCHVLREG